MTLRDVPWRTRLRLPLLLLLGLNAALFLAYTLPRTLEERSLVGHRLALAKEVERQRQIVARLEDRAETIRANAADLERFYGEVVKDGASLVPVLQEVDRAARSGGTRSYHPEEVKGAPLQRFVVTMPLSGSYAELVAFLDRLERFPHFVTVDRISLREKKEQGEADLDVVISAYFKAAPGEARRAR